MSRTTTIYCDACGAKECDFNHATLWHRLSTKGWGKGPRVEGVTTHFCNKAKCQQALQNMRGKA